MTILSISTVPPVVPVGEQQQIWSEFDPFDLSAFSSTPSWVSGTTDATTVMPPGTSLPETLPTCAQRDPSLPFSVDFVHDQIAVSNSSSATAPCLLDERQIVRMAPLSTQSKITTVNTDFDTRILSDADDFTTNIDFNVQTSPILVDFPDTTCNIRSSPSNTNNITSVDEHQTHLSSEQDQQLSITSIQSTLLPTQFHLHPTSTSLLEHPSQQQPQQIDLNHQSQTHHHINTIPSTSTNMPIMSTPNQFDIDHSAHRISPGASSTSLRSVSSQHHMSPEKKLAPTSIPTSMHQTQPSLTLSQTPTNMNTTIPVSSRMNMNNQMTSPSTNNFTRVSTPTIGRVQKQTRRYTAPKSSRYCHLCARHQRSVSMVPCGNVELGLCQKSVCKKCIDLYHLEVSGPFWACPHCQNNCPNRAKCFAYDRQTARRREKTLRAKLHSMSANAATTTSPSTTTKVVGSTTAPVATTSSAK